MRALAFWSVFISFAFAFAGLFVALFGFVQYKNTPMGVTGVLLIVIPVAGALWIWRKSTQKGRPGFDAALRDNFSAHRSNWYDASGIAIDKAAGKLLLGEATATRAVPVTAVTDISFVPQRIPRAGTGIMALIGIFSQIGAASHNFSKAGLFVGADGQRTRVIGVKQSDGDQWLALIKQARGGA